MRSGDPIIWTALLFCRVIVLVRGSDSLDFGLDGIDDENTSSCVLDFCVDHRFSKSSKVLCRGVEGVFESPSPSPAADSSSSSSLVEIFSRSEGVLGSCDASLDDILCVYAPGSKNMERNAFSQIGPHP